MTAKTERTLASAGLASLALGVWALGRWASTGAVLAVVALVLLAVAGWRDVRRNLANARTHPYQWPTRRRDA